jgi:sigma-B regulation protein RsbQ
MSEAALPRNNVRVVGAGKQTIIFAHGFGTDQTAWRHQEAALAKQFRLVLFDHVGAGRADSAAYSPRRYKGLHNYASDLLEIYAALHLTDTVYVGHSMGGMIGLLAGIAQPRLFRKMIFVGASPCYLTEPGYTGGFDQASLDGLYAAMASNYHAWASGFAGLAMGNPERPELSAEFARTIADIRPDIAVAVARIIFQSDYRAELPKLKVPTLIVQSTEDIAVPLEVGQYLAAHIPHATLQVIDARGHLPHLSAPEAVTDAIRAFIT